MKTEKQKQIASMWEKNLGFTPEKTLETDNHKFCHNCKGYVFTKLTSPPWTSKYRCNYCGYYTYIAHQDKMGTEAPDWVALDKRNSYFGNLHKQKPDLSNLSITELVTLKNHFRTITKNCEAWLTNARVINSEPSSGLPPSRKAQEEVELSLKINRERHTIVDVELHSRIESIFKIET